MAKSKRVARPARTTKPARVGDLAASWDEDAHPEEEFSPSERHLLFYKSRKKLVTMYLDADVAEWFRGPGYQKTINSILRLAMVHGVRDARIGKARR